MDGQSQQKASGRADAVAKRYRPWPKGLRADSLPWFDSPLVQGASRLRYTDKAQMQRPGHTGRKALATKKKKQKASGRNTTTRWIKHLKKSLRTWPIPVSTRQFLRAQQQHRLLNGILPWKPTGLHIMVVSERAALRVPKPKERGGRDEKLHGQSGMRCTRLYRTVSPWDLCKVHM